MKGKTELVAPAGNMDCARAAVANGADAVYFGLSQFNARQRADNFTEESFPDLVAFLHEHRVKAYCTFNTLVFTGEMPAAERQLILLDEAGVDAMMVQDLGLAALARELGVRMELHASTQMTVTSPEALRVLAGLGIRRVVLARELALREIAAFQNAGIETEVFVHGALCVAYSGQCLTSEALGQRSANRGECASACRLPYDLIVDGTVKDLGERRYLLSPRDLAGAREIPELMRLGVAAFKIEGRLKSPEYVAATCQVYRKAMDGTGVDEADWYKLEMAFSRGLHTGWLQGVNHQKLVDGRFGAKRGPLIGTVQSVGYDSVEVDCRSPLRAGDGILFEGGKEQGGRIWEVRGTSLLFERGKIDFRALKPGDRVWKTSDPHLERALRKTFQGEIPVPKTPIDLLVSGEVEKPLTVECAGVRVASRMPLQTAFKHPLTEKSLRDSLGRLGETRFALGELTNRLVGQVILPVSELNRLRRELVEKLQTGSCESIRSPLPARRSAPRRKTTRGDKTEIQLIALCRTMEQLLAAFDAGCETVYADFEDIRRYADAVTLARSRRAAIFLAMPRILKPGEQGFLKAITQINPDGLLVRSLAGLESFSGRRVGDFSLNVANPLAAEFFIKAGLERVTVSYDLNAEQALDLLQAAPLEWFEVVLHQHLPMFHMDHCVWAAFMSDGTDHTNCGLPCKHHAVKLQDRVGAQHPVKADVGCRNTVFHARAQSGAEFVESFKKAGVRVFRVELLDEDATQSRAILESYRKLLAGQMTAEALARQVKAVNQLGVTNGTLTVLR